MLCNVCHCYRNHVLETVLSFDANIFNVLFCLLVL
jgi:hypothetical protein